MDSSTLYRAAGYMMAGGGAIKLLSLGTFYLVLNGLGVAGYGEYTLIVAAISLFGVFYRVVSGQIYQIELSRLIGISNLAAVSRLRVEVFIIITCVNILLVTFIVGVHLVFYYSNILVDLLYEYIDKVLVSALYLFTYSYKGIVVSTNFGYGRFKQQAQWDVAEALWRLVLVFLYCIIDRNGLTVLDLLIIDWISLIFGWCTYRIFYSRDVLFGRLDDISLRFPLLHLIRGHGGWLFLNALIVELTANMRLWLIGHLSSIEAIGIFNAAKRIVQSGKILLPFGVLLNSFLSRNSHSLSDLRNSFIYGLNLSIQLSVLVLLLLCVVSLTIVPLAFPNIDGDLQMLIVILSNIYLFKAGSYSVKSMLAVDKRYVETLYAVSLQFVLMLLLLPLFIHHIGIYGVALESVVSSAVGFSLAYYLMIKRRPELAIRLQDLRDIFRLESLSQLKKILRG